MQLSISNDIVSAKICGRRSGFGFGVVGFPVLDGGVPRSAHSVVYFSLLFRFSGSSGRVAGFGTRDRLLARGLLERGYGFSRLARPFLGFVDDDVVWCLNSGLGLGLSCAGDFRSPGSVVAWCVSWGRLLALVFFGAVHWDGFPLWGDWLWRWCVAAGCVLGGQHGRGYRLCFPLWLHACGPGFGLCGGSGLGAYLLVGWFWGPGALAAVWPAWVCLLGFFCFSVQFYLLLSPYLCFISFLYLDLYVLGDDALIS